MLTQQDSQKFKTLCKQHKRVAVFMDFIGDDLTPISALHHLQCETEEFVLLESCDTEQINAATMHDRYTQFGRYSFIGLEAVFEFKSFGNKIFISEHQQQKTLTGDPIALFHQYQQAYHAHAEHPLAGFLGGMVGYISYDAIRLQEAIPDKHVNTHDTPDLYFKVFKHIVTFDRLTRKIAIGTIVDTTQSKDLDKSFDEAMKTLMDLKHAIYHPQQEKPTHKQQPMLGHDTVTDEIDDTSYHAIINQAKAYIKEGDAFQIVPSRCFSKKTTAKPLDIYRAMRLTNPSPFMFYINTKDCVLAGASPEKLISVQDGIIETCPIAGTRLRQPGQDETEIEKELLSDPKEISEHMMLIDLARNDIGRVSEIGSVKITRLKEIVKFSHVMHISSTVQGKLRNDVSPLQALLSAFPAGTLTGAPKIRAMEIIDELEQSRRGVYGGAVCMFDSKGNLNSCIAIRMALCRDGEVVVRAGGGVVADSDPQSEADETRNKAKAVLTAVRMAEEGL